MNIFQLLQKGFRQGTRGSLAFVVLAALLPSAVLAQMGNDNPTGPAGVFAEVVTTGGAYNPYTGNAIRSITDLAVTGSVGKYPLALNRVSNSRYGVPSVFGSAGAWRHSFDWTMDDSDYVAGGSTRPSSYTVNFPDGRTMTFSAASGDPYFRAGPGVRERLTPLAVGQSRVYVLLPDGGKVEFLSTQRSDPELINQYWFTYQAKAIIDPHGLRTSLYYNADGTFNYAMDASSRWLQLQYITTPWVNSNGLADRVVDRAVSSDGRSVKYNYGQASYAPGTATYTFLATVVYFGDNNLTSYYTYQSPNVGSPDGIPLLAACDDKMYNGPMKRIGYSYRTANNADGSAAVYGQIESEKSAVTGQAVTTLGKSQVHWRSDSRGDGYSRTFIYSAPGQVQSVGDFHGYPAYQNYDANGFLNQLNDRNNNITYINSDALTGNIKTVTHPLTDSNVARGEPAGTVQYVYGNPACHDPNNRDGNNPYYLCSVTDERGFMTKFTRDVNKRVTRIDYPDNSAETFAYNTMGQVTSHRLRSGGLETFTYNTRYLLTQYRDPYHLAAVDPQNPSVPASASPTYSYTYYTSGAWLDRLRTIVNTRGHTTTIDQYNSRGQTLKIINPIAQGEVTASFAQRSYNSDGTLATATNELGHTTSYAYDDYKRMTAVTNVSLNQTTTMNYAQDWANPYLHTTSNPKGVTLPSGKVTHYAYDGNWKVTIKREAPGTADDAWTFYGWDKVGTLAGWQDPRGNVTNIDYDQRQRRKLFRPAPPFNNESTQWEYDSASNVTKETRNADGSYRRFIYDSMNRLSETYGFSNERTQYIRNLAGDVTQMIDAKHASYGFGYDLMSRKTSASYPADVYNIARTESWRYDNVGNMDLYSNLASQYKHFEYDSRNRARRTYWNWSAASTTPDWFGPEVIAEYDPASRVASVATKLWGTSSNETLVEFGYDAANRQTWEKQTLTGYPTRLVETPRNADGDRAYLHSPGVYWTNFQYTERNQLKSVDGFATFEYDLNGNMTRRRGTWYYEHGTWFSYDQLNRPITIDHGDQYQFFQHNHYQYDGLGRQVATWRDEQASKGERFYYSPTNQLTNVRYNADQVWTGNPVNWDRWVDYGYTSDTLNRWYVNDNGNFGWVGANGVNQYTGVGGQTPQYDGNLNLIGFAGFSASYDAENRMYHATRNGNTVQFTYDGLGRCVRRTVNGNARLFTYDGWKPMLEWDGAGNFMHWNMYGAGPDEILARNDGLFYKQDHRGNVVALLGTSNNILEKYTYDAFGNPKITDAHGNVRTESAYGNRFMFTGREYIKELGIYDYRNRMYHPDLGRFMQKDPIGFDAGDANLFRYCGNDPVNRTDPFGLHSWDNPPDYPPLSGEQMRGIGQGMMSIGGYGAYVAAGTFFFHQAASGYIAASSLLVYGAGSWLEKNAPYAPVESYSKPPPPKEDKDEEPTTSGNRGSGSGGEGGTTGSSSSGSSITVTSVVYVGTPTTYGSPTFNDLMSQPGAFYVVSPPDSSTDRLWIKKYK